MLLLFRSGWTDTKKDWAAHPKLPVELRKEHNSPALAVTEKQLLQDPKALQREWNK